MGIALRDALVKIEQQAIRHKERKMTVKQQRKPNSTELIEVRSPAAIVAAS